MYLEAITSKQKRILDKLKNFPEYYLGGGTALALQVGHRISVDFDLFSRKNIPSGLLSKVERVFQDSRVEVTVNHLEQLSVNIDQTRVDFVKYPFPLILKPVKFQGVSILQVPEIAAMKAYVLGRRATFKDYIDLYYILKGRDISLGKIIKFAGKKYKDEFDPRLFLEQLIYLRDVEDMEIQFLKEKISRAEIQEFFEKEIKKLKL